MNLSGPYYNWNRWYDPNTGRDLQAEPLLQRNPRLVQARQGLGSIAGGVLAPPAYAYAMNSPLAYIDPNGDAATREEFCRETGVCRPQDFCRVHPEMCHGPDPAPTPTPPLSCRNDMGCFNVCTALYIECASGCSSSSNPFCILGCGIARSACYLICLGQNLPLPN